MDLSSPEHWADQLQCFIQKHFLNDDDLQAEFASGHRKNELWPELGRMILKRFLLLALLLDHTISQSPLPRGTPLLFKVDAKIKSSAEV